MSDLSQIGIIPAILITLGGLLVLRSRDAAKARQRFLLYLLIVGNLLLMALFASIQLTPAQDNRPFWQVAAVLIPAIVGVLALVVLHARHLLSLNWGAKCLALLLAAGLVGLIAVEWNTRFELAYRILPGVLVLVLGWALARRFQKTAVLLAIFLLLSLFGLTILMNMPAGTPPSPPPTWLQIPLRLGLELLPGLMTVIPAVLFTNSLQSRTGKTLLLPIIIALGLLAYLAYTIFWASVWDQTSDGLGGLFLSQLSSLVAVGAGMTMAVTLTGWQRSAGLLFAILVPILLSQSFSQGWQVSYHELTEARAERITQALAAYHEREGVYPPTLNALTPRYLLRLPHPVELQGETWCYQGGDDFYRLGAFFREFFSMPVTLRVYAAAGEPDSVWDCESQLAAMKERYYSPMEDPEAMRSPLPTPLPPSEVAIEEEILMPLLEGNDLLWGSWSPDSAYFLLGKQATTGGVNLFFLDGQSGELCPAAGTYFFAPLTVNLRARHAWLPDGQLLLLDDTEQVMLLAPCATEARNVTPASTEGLEYILAGDSQNGRLLLQSSDEFWIFDSRTLTWQLIPEVTPNPYDAHWDNASWQPGGEQLAISRLNGRDASDGSTLYLIAGETGEVVRSMPLATASDQSAAHAEWVSSHEMLLHGGGRIHLLDITTDPPQSMNVLAEIFGLDLDFATGEISGHGWQVDEENDSFILTVQANHPRNDALYIYQSAAGTVDVYNEETHLLLLYPDGQMEQRTKPAAEAAYEDVFALLDLRDGSVQPPLAITGHTPRDYPHLSITYLASREQLAVASSQGISLHTLSGGDMSNFWRLAGQGFPPFLLPAPDGSALVAVRDQGGIYWLPLP